MLDSMSLLFNIFSHTNTINIFKFIFYAFSPVWNIFSWNFTLIVIEMLFSIWFWQCCLIDEGCGHVTYYFKPHIDPPLACFILFLELTLSCCLLNSKVKNGKLVAENCCPPFDCSQLADPLRLKPLFEMSIENKTVKTTCLTGLKTHHEGSVRVNFLTC